MSLDDTILKLCDGCKQVLEEVDCERLITVLVGIQVRKEDEEFQIAIPQELIEDATITK